MALTGILVVGPTMISRCSDDTSVVGPTMVSRCSDDRVAKATIPKVATPTIAQIGAIITTLGRWSDDIDL